MLPVFLLRLEGRDVCGRFNWEFLGGHLLLDHSCNIVVDPVLFLFLCRFFTFGFEVFGKVKFCDLTEKRGDGFQVL